MPPRLSSEFIISKSFNPLTHGVCAEGRMGDDGTGENEDWRAKHERRRLMEGWTGSLRA